MALDERETAPVPDKRETAPDLGDFFKAKPKKQNVSKLKKLISSAHQSHVPNETQFKRSLPTPGLIQSCCAGDPFSLRAAIAAGNDVEEVDGKGRTPLMNASIAGNSRVVATLIEAKADVNAATAKGISPLIFCTMSRPSIRGSGGEICVPQLLRAKAHVNATTHQGLTALMQAASQGNAAVAMSLLAAHADPNLVHSDSTTALMLAADSGSSDIVDALLQANAHVNAADSEGVTALIKATERRHVTVVKLLLNEGAIAEIRDIDGDSAFEIAIRDGDESLVEALDKVISRIVVNLIMVEVDEDNMFRINCLGISGSEIASLVVPQDCSVGFLREEIAKALKIQPSRVRLLCGVLLLDRDIQILNEALHGAE